MSSSPMSSSSNTFTLITKGKRYTTTTDKILKYSEKCKHHVETFSDLNEIDLRDNDLSILENDKLWNIYMSLLNLNECSEKNINDLLNKEKISDLIYFAELCNYMESSLFMEEAVKIIGTNLRNKSFEQLTKDLDLDVSKFTQEEIKEFNKVLVPTN